MYHSEDRERAGRAGGPEQRLVQQLVAQMTVEALVEAVLLRLAWRDLVPASVSWATIGWR